MANVKSYAMIAVVAIVTVIMFPLAMQQIIANAGSTWNSAVSVIWKTLVPVLAVISIAILFIGKGGKGE